MLAILRIALAMSICLCLGCGNKPTNDYDITKDPNYHSNPDPRSYTDFYDNTPVNPKKQKKKR